MPTSTLSSATTTIKRCSKCNKDVSGVKRLKDAKGHYWCTDCGAPDAATSGQGLLTPCPKCHTPIHPAHFVRKNSQYVCENCAAGIKTPGGKVLTDDQAAQRKKLILAGTLLGLGAVAYGVLNFVVFA